MKAEPDSPTNSPARGFAETPEPPYYAVIFTSLRTEGERGYDCMAERMVELARQQPGYLGIESVRGPDGLGITVSYWTSEETIARWKAQAEHKIAQETGRRIWYSDYRLRVARVERAYGKPAEGAPPNGGLDAQPGNPGSTEGPASVT